MSKNYNITQIGEGNKTSIGGDRKSTTIKISIGAIVIVAILAIVFMVSSGGVEKKIIGKWQLENTNAVYEFTKDGQFLFLSGSSDGATISYTIDGKRLYLNVNILWANSTVSADITVSDSKLVLSNFIDPDDLFNMRDGEEMRFTRVD